MPVRCAVIEPEHQPIRFRIALQIGKRLIAAGRILGQDHPHLPTGYVKALHASETSFRQRQCLQDLFHRQPCSLPGTYCPGGIIDVIERRKADPDLLPLRISRLLLRVRCPHPYCHTVRIRGEDLRDLRFRTYSLIPALRTEKASKMRKSMIPVFVSCAAADTVLGVSVFICPVLCRQGTEPEAADPKPFPLRHRPC